MTVLLGIWSLLNLRVLTTGTSLESSLWALWKEEVVFLALEIQTVKRDACSYHISSTRMCLFLHSHCFSLVDMSTCSWFSSIAPKFVPAGHIKTGISVTDSRRGSTARKRDIGAECWEGGKVACREWMPVTKKVSAAGAVLKTSEMDSIFRYQELSWSFHHLTLPSMWWKITAPVFSLCPAVILNTLRDTYPCY